MYIYYIINIVRYILPKYFKLGHGNLHTCEIFFDGKRISV